MFLSSIFDPGTQNGGRARAHARCFALIYNQWWSQTHPASLMVGPPGPSCLHPLPSSPLVQVVMAKLGRVEIDLRGCVNDDFFPETLLHGLILL